MANYIWSELYRTYRRKYPYLLMGAALAAGLMSFSISPPLVFIVCYYGLVLIVHCVFSDEYIHHTLKNTVSYGIGRRQIYLGKYLAALLVALSTLPFALLPGILLFQPDRMGLMLAGAFPLLTGGLAIATLLHFLLRGRLVPVVYWGLITLLPVLAAAILMTVSSSLSRTTEFFLFSQFFRLGERTAFHQLWEPLLVGTFWTVIPTVAGILLFQKKEFR